MPPPLLHPFRSGSLVDVLQEGCDEIQASTLSQFKMLQDHAPMPCQHDCLSVCLCVKCELCLRVNYRVSR